MSNKPIGLILVLTGGALFLLFNSFFVVNQMQAALVTEFGRPVKVEQDAGLKFKIPFIQTVEYFDRRILEYKMQNEVEINAADQKRLVVRAYLKWRITDPLQFYMATSQAARSGLGGSKVNVMNGLLAARLDASLRQVLGNVPLNALLSPERSRIMNDIRNLVNASESGVSAAYDAKNPVNNETVAQDMRTDSFGVEIIDVRIIQADLPDANSNAIFRRMQTEREREAKEIRAKGEEDALRIRAKADKERTILIAEAQKKSETMRGEGDSEATKIYAAAYNKDASFFEFYRSMQAYQRTLDKSDTTMVLSPDSKFLRQLEQ
jgi:membrane protease subunit HflC